MVTMPAFFKCWDCKEPLPKSGAGKCGKCAGAKGNASSLFPTPPMCGVCKKGLPHDPKGPMGWANPPHTCKEAA